jgi:hypothetical protein
MGALTSSELRCGDDGAADTGNVARGLAGVLAQGPPPRA